MVEASNKTDLLEAVEKGQYEIPSVAEVGCVSIDGLAICEYSQIVLAHGKQLDISDDADQWFSLSKGMGLSWGRL